MRKFCLLIVFLFFSAINLFAQEINFPPELLWWLYEVKKANPRIEINKFTFGGKEIKKFGVDKYYQGALVYPIFMRWNYSANYVAYNGAELVRTRTGKYGVLHDADSFLYIADKNKIIFFMDSFGIRSGLNAIHWLTDTVLIAVGVSITDDEPFNVDLFIIEYKINASNKTVESNFFWYKKALKNSDRINLKLNWYEQRPDYFEIEE